MVVVAVAVEQRKKLYRKKIYKKKLSRETENKVNARNKANDHENKKQTFEHEKNKQVIVKSTTQINTFVYVSICTKTVHDDNHIHGDLPTIEHEKKKERYHVSYL